jgi:hypothetical protein
MGLDDNSRTNRKVMITKNHILSEIKRTAKENGGIPLGMGRFEKETGIKKADWEGKYWSKWSDAVRAAGYEPNKKQGAYDKEFLIKELICLIREIRKFPTGPEIKLKHFNDKNFPSHSAFYERLSYKKHEMAQQILTYCEDKSDYEDVIKICKKVCDSTEKEEEYDSKKVDVKFSFVYLMKSGRHYKIGRSDCVEKRAREIGIKLPEEPKTIHQIKTDDPIGIEAYWHKRFADKRKNGEWFDLSSSDVSIFKRRKFM